VGLGGGSNKKVEKKKRKHRERRERQTVEQEVGVKGKKKVEMIASDWTGPGEKKVSGCKRLRKIRKSSGTGRREKLQVVEGFQT